MWMRVEHIRCAQGSGYRVYTFEFFLRLTNTNLLNAYELSISAVLSVNTLCSEMIISRLASVHLLASTLK